MGYLSDYVCNQMHIHGFPAVEGQLLRSFQKQNDLFMHYLTDEPPGASPSEYWMGFNIEHEDWSTFHEVGAPDGSPFWEALEGVIAMANAKFKVRMVPGRTKYDPGEYVLEDWREVLDAYAKPPNPGIIDARSNGMLAFAFRKKLPDVWAKYEDAHPGKAAELLAHS